MTYEVHPLTNADGSAAPICCAKCEVAIRRPRNCRVIIYHDIWGKPESAGLLCPDC